MSEPRTRLYLVTPPIGAAADLLVEIEAALGAGDVACLLLRLKPAAERDLKQIVKAIATAVQAAEPLCWSRILASRSMPEPMACMWRARARRCRPRWKA